MNCELEDKIFTSGSGQFVDLALEIFRFQYHNNQVYKAFTDAIGVEEQTVSSLESIPFLPVSFFKTQELKTTSFKPETVFESSGTTSTGNSRHYVRSVDIYRKSFLKAFERFYGPVTGWCVLGLLPAYMERKDSSLVMMAEELIRASNHPLSGSYLYEHDKLMEILKKNEQAHQKTMLIGVTFALLDLSEKYHSQLKYTTVMETGGMKGRRKELTRSEVHEILKNAWGLSSVHSEYGMTELLSQAYSDGEGIFRCPPWMKILVREEDDPLTINNGQMGNGRQSQNGIINVIDLANLYSCSFIATDDIGRLDPDGSFQVLGRMDSSDARGCNLMVV